MKIRVLLLSLLPMLALPAFSSPVKSDSAAKSIAFTDDSAPTAADYVQDGLIYMWDGYENVAWREFDPTSTEWVDLVQGERLIPTAESIRNGDEYVWVDGGLKRIGIGGMSAKLEWFYDATDESQYTIEIVLSDTSQTSPDAVVDNAYYYANIGGHLLSHQRGRHYLIDYTGNQWHETGCSMDYAFPVSTFSFVALGVPFPTQISIDRNTFDSYLNGRVFRRDKPLSVAQTDMKLFAYTRVWPDIRETTCFSIRIYSRKLSDKEVSYNSFLDRLRFNLP